MVTSSIPGRRQVLQDLALGDVSLHLLRQRHHPSEHVRLVFAVRMHAARHVHALDGAALRLAAAVAAEHPAVALFAAVKGDLLFVLDLARVVAGEGVALFPPRLFPSISKIFSSISRSYPLSAIFPLFFIGARRTLPLFFRPAPFFSF